MNGDSIRVWDVKNVVNSAGMFESAQWFKEDMIEKWTVAGWVIISRVCLSHLDCLIFHK